MQCVYDSDLGSRTKKESYSLTCSKESYSLTCSKANAVVAVSPIMVMPMLVFMFDLALTLSEKAADSRGG